ncbi:hypothetical protein WJ0W_005949 [Paenibacillus melissococcoides]|uniref:Uncharacterized protein n=1 Tax=Paenibacillus melissococcoides TaxID=2912268 RepID=A0ABN8UCB3_9BACL|nr:MULTISPECIES: hypothetical protein [Paenibacillus]MEB9896683.1 hypothetical protein [Bacillus cereus]CAH8248765.1 hypothetical protein WJ0W_005949 [Paenibacillus melissococcoides]CAH8713797.1 hypothetical protein WDD9_003665 [Paenibacillus melissococcoides]CAH8720436.1 hypothetical protein HTL2_005942 [Paenibacillus melissococcoides]GIO78446.1 hypothetical protein J6TS7_20560 [Paenibacillus dendritiformis]
MTTLSKAELKMKLNAWAKEANEKSKTFLNCLKESQVQLYECKRQITGSFVKFFIQNMKPEEVEICKREAKNLSEKYDFDKLAEMDSYGMMNPLVTLRIHSRKLREIVRRFNKEKAVLKKLLGELKQIDIQAKERFKEKYCEVDPTITAYREMLKGVMEEELFEGEIDYWVLIEGLFSDGRKMKRDDFLQVVTVDKSLRYSDGSPIESYVSRVADIPEEIDFDTFEDLIVLKRIEADFDYYLHDAWMEHFFIVKEEYKRQTGEEAFDSFKLLEDITGKPLQTYTAEVDEYGDVVNMIPNKPELRVVENDADH